MDPRYQIEAHLEGLRANHQWRSPVSASPRSLIHNDYLGLSSSPKVLSAGRSYLNTGLAGSRGSRLLGGHSAIFEDVEAQICEVLGAPAALFFSSGYLANLAVTRAASFVGERFVSDELNHASLIDGIRLTGKPKSIQAHGQLQPSENGDIIVSESLFSMDGDFIDTAQLASWQNSNQFLILDEAHCMGIAPGDGLGFHRAWESWENKCVTVTFGKSFGVSGAALLCSEAFRALLINEARSFIYTTAPSPVVAVMVGAALNVWQKEVWRREALWEKVRWLRKQLEGRALQGKGPWDEVSPIVALPIRGTQDAAGAQSALNLAESMRKSGLEVRAIRYPTVARGSERIRISVSADTSWELLKLLVKETRWMESL